MAFSNSTRYALLDERSSPNRDAESKRKGAEDLFDVELGQAGFTRHFRPSIKPYSRQDGKQAFAMLSQFMLDFDQRSHYAMPDRLLVWLSTSQGNPAEKIEFEQRIFTHAQLLLFILFRYFQALPTQLLEPLEILLNDFVKMDRNIDLSFQTAAEVFNKQTQLKLHQSDKQTNWIALDSIIQNVAGLALLRNYFGNPSYELSQHTTPSEGLLLQFYPVSPLVMDAYLMRFELDEKTLSQYENEAQSKQQIIHLAERFNTLLLALETASSGQWELTCLTKFCQEVNAYVVTKRTNRDAEHLPYLHRFYEKDLKRIKTTAYAMLEFIWPSTDKQQMVDFARAVYQSSHIDEGEINAYLQQVALFHRPTSFLTRCVTGCYSFFNTDNRPFPTPAFAVDVDLVDVAALTQQWHTDLYQRRIAETFYPVPRANGYRGF